MFSIEVCEDAGEGLNTMAEWMTIQDVGDDRSAHLRKRIYYVLSTRDCGGSSFLFDLGCVEFLVFCGFWVGGSVEMGCLKEGIWDALC